MKPEESNSYPKEGREFLKLAEKYFSSGDIEKAIEICEKGEKNNPDYITLKFFRSKLLYHIKRFEQAKKIIELILKEKPDYVPGYKILGDIFIQEQNWEQAKVNFQKALFLDPWDDTIQERLESIEKIKKEKGLKNGDIFLTPSMAELYVKQGLVLEAVNIYRKLYKARKNKKYLERIEELENSTLYRKNILENQIFVFNSWLKAISNLKNR
jgi:tetratricopeptide (TPR) repeat protein